jgi:hypothetical protein
MVEFEVFTAVTKKSSIFWDTILCSPTNVDQQFEATHHLHLQGQTVSQELFKMVE